MVIPTGHHRDLVAVAADRPVTLEFEQFDPDGRHVWVVRGAGVARPIGRRERPPAADTATALAMTYAFDNGIAVRMEELAGRRVRLP